MYSGIGLCRVEEIGFPAALSSAQPGQLYYTLVPIYQQGTIYMPTNTTVLMRPALSRQEALDLIAKIPNIGEDSFQCRDQRLLAEHYRSFLRTQRCEDLVLLIKNIYSKDRAIARQGKKPGRTDIEYQKRAEELLHGELANALEISIDEVPNFIRQMIS